MSMESKLFSEGDEKTLLMVAEWLELKAISMGPAKDVLGVYGRYRSESILIQTSQLWELVWDIREQLALKERHEHGSGDRSQDDH